MPAGTQTPATASRNGPANGRHGAEPTQSLQAQPYQVIVSRRFLVSTVLAAAALAFATGRFVCAVLVAQQLRSVGLPSSAVAALQTVPSLSSDTSSNNNNNKYSSSSSNRYHHNDNENNLPPPLVKGEKTVPVTVYTSKHFDTAKAKSTASLFLQKDQMKAEPKKSAMTSVSVDTIDTAAASKHVKSDENALPSSPDTPLLLSTYSHDSVGLAFRDNRTDSLQTNQQQQHQQQEEEEHLPAGQHLLADIDNVQMAFLDSKKRLADAMVELVYECGLTMLSYHCHRLTPSGVSCAGVLLESHVSFHTWPEAGVITLDLFTCGSASLLPIVPMVEKLFALQREDTIEPPRMVWSYKRRGFAGFSNINNDNTDFFSYPVGIHGMQQKREITAFETQQQHTRIRIYDILHEEKQDELDRHVFVNGRLKYQSSHQAAGQESMVHPAMLTHDNPTRVALVGGSEGGSIREVLKHKSVKKVVLLEKEPELVRLAKSELASWNDCSDLVGSKPNCFEDARIQLFYADATKWFSHTTEEPFDVIILDEPLYDAVSLRSLFSSLNEDGIVVMHLFPKDDVSDSQRSQKRRAEMYNQQQQEAKEQLAAAGFAESRYYEEVHGGYVDVKGFVVAFKSSDSIPNWSRNEAQVDLELMQRAAATVSGQSPFQYFDGTTMRTYQDASARKPDTSKLARPQIPLRKNAPSESCAKPKNTSNSGTVDESCTNSMASMQ